MIDVKRIRKEPELIKELLSRRNPDLAKSIDEVIAIDEEHRVLMQEQQELQARRNELSKLVGQKKSKGEDAEAEMTELNELKTKLKDFSEKEPEFANRQKDILAGIPNLPDPEIPQGKSEEENQEIMTWGEPRVWLNEKGFNAKDQDELLDKYGHDIIGQGLGIFDFERGVKIAKSRFTLLRGMGARLERALINFFLDKAAENGYEEVFPPIIVNSNALKGTGQLPKFKEDLFKLEDQDLYLIPTAEVPVTNIYQDEILKEEQLPVYFCAYTPNFRSEAGSASKDTRGIIRQHQFNKVELVKICKPEDSKTEHEKLTENAEALLQALELPYRKVLLCTGDIGFSAEKCYDLEVWFPSQAKYREISSCSNFNDFQARRAQIRFKRSEPKAKAELVHTLNGSGLAVGRTMAALLENHYNPEDNSVAIPQALIPYMGGITKITAEKQVALT